MSSLGHVYSVQPMAPDADHTVWLDAGPLRVGVEYRELDPDALNAYYTGTDLEEVQQNSPDGGFVDQGLSLHIESVTDGHEYLRFDVFDDDPHYHYVDKVQGTNTVIGFDRAANGEMLDWVLRQLTSRLAPMLEAAGAAQVAASLAPDAGQQIVARLRVHLTDLGVIDPAS